MTDTKNAATPGLIPADAKRKQNNVIAEGEMTGHYHAASGGGIALLERGEELFLDAPNGGEITHQEHNTVTVPPGQYERHIVKEYDPFEEQIRNIRD